jgi:alpha-tubulin suppressor-like RCC1 family protein
MFTLGWNSSNLYSWGFGMNYVLLNGQEEDEFRPFRVKPKILNEQRIFQVSAGAQHVAYLSYSDTQHQINQIRV